MTDSPIDRLRDLCQEYDLAPVQYLEAVLEVLDDPTLDGRDAIETVVSELLAPLDLPAPRPRMPGEPTSTGRARPTIIDGVPVGHRKVRPAPRLKDPSQKTRPRLPDGLGLGAGVEES